jgi:hypothetical protein
MITGRRVRGALRRNRAVRTATALYRHRVCSAEDVVVASYPKSGNTWLKFVLADLLAGHETDFDLAERAIPLLGRPRAGTVELPGGGHLWKSHEPYSPLFRRRCTRAIYLVRDGRDVLISEYHFLRRKGRFAGGLDEFVDVFIRGKADGYGSWDKHVESWLDGWRGPRDARLILRYEDMLVDCAAALTPVTSFLGLPVQAEQLELAVQRNSFTSMRAKELATPRLATIASAGVAPLVRAGRAGQWRIDLTAEQRSHLWSAMPQLARLGYEA